MIDEIERAWLADKHDLGLARRYHQALARAGKNPSWSIIGEALPALSWPVARALGKLHIVGIHRRMDGRVLHRFLACQNSLSRISFIESVHEFERPWPEWNPAMHKTHCLSCARSRWVAFLRGQNVAMHKAEIPGCLRRRYGWVVKKPIAGRRIATITRIPAPIEPEALYHG